jgi:hypothetical protein
MLGSTEEQSQLKKISYGQEETMNKLLKRAQQKWSILLRVLPITIVVVVLKVAFHLFGFEVMDLNSLFTTLIGGVVFLLGFLIAGVLSDYKESEKIPSELSSSCEALFDKTLALFEGKDSITAKRFIEYQKLFISSLNDWFYEKETTESILSKIGKMSDFFAGYMGEGVEASYITTMENDQSNLRKTTLRAATIRDTEFIAPAYGIVEVMGLLLTGGMLFIKIEPFGGSLFYNVLIPLLIFYVLFLLRDLDNPFEYSTKRRRGIEVSLEPIHEWKSRAEKIGPK